MLKLLSVSDLAGGMPQIILANVAGKNCVSGSDTASAKIYVPRVGGSFSPVCWSGQTGAFSSYTPENQLLVAVYCFT